MAFALSDQTVSSATTLTKKRELRTHWQRACKVILAKKDVLTVSSALETRAVHGREPGGWRH
jgi:hypothetical protein